MYEPDFTPVAPWPLPSLEECFFHTCMDLGNGEAIDSVHWDLRGQFEAYIGGVDLTGKTVLDVGTASGFLAFSAEDAGAERVTAVDALHGEEFQRIPFKGSPFTQRRRKWIADADNFLTGLKKSFWYAWHKRKSSVEVVYVPISEMWKWRDRFDVVIAGAIVEHLSDPVSFIHTLARLANETVVIAFTPIADSEDQFMRTMNDWDNPKFNYSWFELSLGLYRRLFTNLGFSIEIKTAQALCHEYDPPLVVQRPTIIARRIPAASA